MIMNFLTRYHPRYIRSLVYMLQASEYHIGDYLAWFHRTRNFTTVENRKQLQKNTKARLILAIAWILVIALVAIAVWLFSYSGVRGYTLGVLILISTPYIIAYGIILPLLAIQIIIQKPIEYLIVKKAKATLAKHKGVKIAIAGSFGKTSMREILKTVLSEGLRVAAPPHSYNTPLGISSFVKTLTGDEAVILFELGEYYPGDVRKLCDLVQPDMGVITGINEAHLLKFKTLERTAATIFELADYLDDRPVYVNTESDLAKKSARPGHIEYSRHGTTDLHVKDVYTDLHGTSFVLVRGNTSLQLSSALLGIHQVGPLVVAADIAFRLGLSEVDVQAGIAKTTPFDHRLEPKTDATGVVTLDDSYNGNPDGVHAVINFLASLTGHRRFYVTPGLVEMGTRTEAVHKTMGGQLAKANIEKVVLIRNSVTPYIEQGLITANYQGEIIWFEDALQAFSALPHITVAGDVVLLQNDWPDQYA